MPPRIQLLTIVFLLFCGPVSTSALPTTAMDLVEELPPEELERRLAAEPARIPGLFKSFSEALAEADDSLAARLGAYLNAVTRARSRRLAARREGWTQDDADLLLALQLVDLRRFAGEAPFRRRVLDLLPGAFDPAASAALRDRLLYRLHTIRGVEFEDFEKIAAAWGALPRSSHDREIRADVRLELKEVAGGIVASVFTMPSGYFSEAAALRFLEAVRRSAPARTILVLSDRPLLEALSLHGTSLGLRFVETWGLPFTPWPRDPLTFLEADDGRRVALLRPPSARQGRPEDSWLGRVLVQGLPEDLDADWRLGWRRSDFPFHNGQILAAEGRLWISLHTLEMRILELLDVVRVPVERFAGADGARYVEAARQAADELGRLYGRDTTFVHPLPGAGATGERRADELARLGGGAGFDLDSFVTLLEGTEAGLVALVGDPRAGAELAGRVPADELDGFASAYGLTPRGEELRRLLREAQGSPRARRLQVFLDLVSEHLSSEAVLRRLPLLLVPRDLQRDRGVAGDPEFLVGWNNVVLERRGEVLRAEGFSSLLPSGDELAKQVFGEHGYRLDLYPPLIESVVRGGGYRCASQHVRR